MSVCMCMYHDCAVVGIGEAADALSSFSLDINVAGSGPSAEALGLK